MATGFSGVDLWEINKRYLIKRIKNVHFEPANTKNYQ